MTSVQRDRLLRAIADGVMRILLNAGEWDKLECNELCEALDASQPVPEDPDE